MERESHSGNYAARQGNNPLQASVRQGPALHRWGANPSAGLIFDQSRGNLYGTTYRGGTRTHSVAAVATGVAWHSSLRWEGKEKVLYSFCAQSGCPDGTQPYAGVSL